MTTEAKSAVTTRRLSKLERCGRYRDALDLISNRWPEEDFVPPVSGLSARDGANLLLRFGSLLGFVGQVEAIDGSQERSRDILMEARGTFLDLRDEEHAAECANRMALTYCRTGEFMEAEVWLDEAFAYDLDPSSDARLYSHLTRGFVLLSLRRHEENIVYSKSVENDFRAFGDAFLNASLCANLGVSLKDTGRSKEALAYFNLARSFHERSRNRLYLAIVENNLALLYKNEGQFSLAHQAVDSAISINKKLRDLSREGSSLETKAQIFVAQGDLQNARHTIDRSIAILRKTENQAYLAESIMTRAKIQLTADSFADAVLTMVEAIEITTRQTGEIAARQLIGEFEAALDLKKAAAAGTASLARINELELIVPPSLGNYASYAGVWINNSALDSIGVKNGSLAVYVDTELRRGDPVVLRENASGEVSCGFYDADFGIVCLVREDDEPQLFDADEVTLLGKVVGVCREERDADGRMVAEPVKSRSGLI